MSPPDKPEEPDKPDKPDKNGKVRRKRLLTGLRPTGKFHLGNYVGTFEKDLELQNSGDYECFFLIADYHTGATRSRAVGEDIKDGLLDFLAVRDRPNQARCTCSR
jgi:tryptophanyl-tRNA synthetase